MRDRIDREVLEVVVAGLVGVVIHVAAAAVGRV